MAHFHELAHCSQAELESVMRWSRAPSPEILSGWEFDGANVTPFAHTPFTITMLGLGVPKFRKGFYDGGADRNPGGPAPFIQGYNVLIRRSRIVEPWVPIPSAENPHRFGYYRVHAPLPGARDSKYPDALLLDYGRGANGNTSGFLRDYLVQPDSRNPDVLVGKAYVALGPLRIFGGYFVLRRAVKHEFTGEPVRQLPAPK